ncbi:GbsR/MarR family transcriptional regulator [Streptomyces mirabilis]|uniref:GbsR/MarR family transcriptional regulator n=1 Tax=Streptomyces mirabilis TaxID=68239 RepID=UPI00381B1959
MPQDTQLTFADRIGHFYARQFGFPPMAGRLLGYLLVCDAPQQSIDQLSDALLASRSAVTGSVKLLESFRMVRRTRMAGDRVDRVCLRPVNEQPQHFDSAVHEEQAALFREGLALLGDAPVERLMPLQEKIALAEFFAERLPLLLDEWRVRRDGFHPEGGSTTPTTSIE